MTLRVGSLFTGFVKPAVEVYDQDKNEGGEA